MKATCIAALGAAVCLSACERLDGGVFTARLAAGEGRAIAAMRHGLRRYCLLPMTLRHGVRQRVNNDPAFRVEVVCASDPS